MEVARLIGFNSFMTVAPPSQNLSPCTDEIDFFDLWVILWEKKLLILGLAALCGLGGFLFATYHPGRPDRYVYTALVEIGRHLTQSGEIQTLESPHDLVLIINQQPGGAKASVPRGSLSLIGIESMHVDRAVARQDLDSTLAFILNRHRALIGSLSKPILINSGLVADPVMFIDSIKGKRMLIMAASAIAGLLLGVFMVLVANQMHRCKVGSAAI